MRKMITPIFFISFLFAQPLFADTVYFKKGKALENVTTSENEKGFWIDGVLFEKQDIDRIEKKPVVKIPPPTALQTKNKGKSSQSSSPNIDARIKKRVE